MRERDGPLDSNRTASFEPTRRRNIEIGLTCFNRYNDAAFDSISSGAADKRKGGADKRCEYFFLRHETTVRGIGPADNGNAASCQVLPKLVVRFRHSQLLRSLR